ncbi:hypothetical protein ACJIZ3_001998 [Penstemon smallii]|uniref:TCP domain-containing protein n=1 Tax=Penstemon smallii TaxID=265156 RepID=A0ABD3U5L0_9LAMI
MIRRDESEYTTKQEYNTTDITKTSKASSSSTTSWSRLKDPRIVRVSRAFGGKDRHSKVCTVRGLRDRRVRLSVPTAIQLYDLQDRLGLNQPSKVVDWLLNAAKNEIDELPPLQIPQGSFIAPNLQTTVPMQNHEEDQLDNNNMQENQDSFVSTTNNFSVPYNSFVRWDPISNLTLSHNIIPTRSHGGEDMNHMNFSLGGGGTQSYFPSHIGNSTNNSELHFHEGSLQLANSESTTITTTQPAVRPFHFLPSFTK